LFGQIYYFTRILVYKFYLLKY